MEYKGYDIPDDLKYHIEHTWVRPESDDTVIVGWSDFAQKLAEDLSSVIVPDEGKSMKQDEYLGTIETGKWVGKLYAPVTGKIIALNEEVLDDPRLVNQDPYGQGWIMKVKITDPASLARLLDSKAYKDAIVAKLKELGMG